MKYTVKRIGLLSAVKIAAIASAALAVVPIVLFLLLNALFKFWDVIIPPELIGQALAGAAFWAALWGGVSAGLAVIVYNVSAACFGGIQVELQAQPGPRKSKEQIDIE